MIISIINQKGGVAKTTSTFNISSILANKGHRVLQIDLDPQASLTIANNMEPVDLKNTVYNVICEKEDIRNAIYEIDENLYILPASIDLSVAELDLVNEMARETILKKALKNVKEEFDYVFIDCPPSLGLLTINSLCASEYVIVPVATDYLSFRGLELLLNTIDKVKLNLNDDLKIMGLIATMYDLRTKHSNEVLDILKEDYKILGVVSNSVKVKDSILANKPLHIFEPEHKTSKEYIRIANNIISETRSVGNE